MKFWSVSGWVGGCVCVCVCVWGGGGGVRVAGGGGGGGGGSGGGGRGGFKGLILLHSASRHIDLIAILLKQTLQGTLSILLILNHVEQ